MSGDFDDVAGFLEDAVKMLKEDEARYYQTLRESRKAGGPPPPSASDHLFNDDVENLIMKIAQKMKVPQPRMSNNPYILEYLRHEAEEREEAAVAARASSPSSVGGASSSTPTLSSKAPPPQNALGVTEEEIVRITSRACVVCGRDDRPIEMRKSGIKCKECKGKPSKKGTRIEVELEVSDTLIKEKAEDGSTIINGFKERKQLGQGAFGKVKLVEHVLQEQLYAMKVLSKKGLTKKVGSREKALEVINNEINLMKTIQHHLVCKVISVIHDPDEDKLYIVMEYLARGQVYALDAHGVGKSPPVPLMKLKKYVLGIARGLQYLHNRNVIHRDIKPENILLDDEDNTKIADFGVSSLCDGEDDAVEGAAGTVPYWPPEMFSADSRTVKGRPQDVWAFGVTIFALATGCLPFRGDWMDCKRQITSGKIDYPADMDATLRDLLEKMLTVDPRRRATIPEVCAHPFVSEIRLSKGFPVEADEVKIAVVKSIEEAEAVSGDTDAILLCPFPEQAPYLQNAGYAELVSFLRGESPGLNFTDSAPVVEERGHWTPRIGGDGGDAPSISTPPNGILSSHLSAASLRNGSNSSETPSPKASSYTFPDLCQQLEGRPALYDPIVGPPPISSLVSAQPTSHSFQVIAGKYSVQLYRRGDGGVNYPKTHPPNLTVTSASSTSTPALL